MPVFNYQAVDGGGNVVQGSLEAREERLVVQHLQQGGLVPLRISLEGEVAAWQAWRPGRLRQRRVSLGEVVNFTQEMAVLLKAGLPLDRSLKALLEVTTRPGLKAILSQLLRDLQGGRSFSEGLSRHPVFSPLYVSLVQAGEAGGFLEEALFRLGEYLKTVKDFRSFLVTALIYPLILALVGGFSVILMLVYVVPSFEAFFREMGQSLTLSTRFLVGLSQAFRSYWWLGALLLAAGLFLGWRLSHSPQGRLAIDRFKITAPWLGNLNRRVAATFFAKTLGTLLANGVPLVSSLRVVTASVNNRYLAQSLSGVAAEVEKGQQLSGPLKRLGQFPELFVQLVAIGEETGRLSEMLLAAAGSLEEESRVALRRFMALLEPILILVMALIVALIIVSLLLPIMNLYDIQF